MIDPSLQKKMLLDVSNLFDRYNIKHCLMFGTLLGAIRDKSFISWDNEDIDLGIYQQFWKDDDLWYNLNLDLNKLGYRIRDMSYNYVCIDNYTDLHVDLYLLIKDEDNYNIIVTGIIATFPASDFDDLIDHEFMGKDFKIPKDIEAHLERNYGKEWRIPQQNTISYSRKNINNYKKITYTYIISVNE